MSTIVPSGKMPTPGILLSWLAGSAVVAMLLFLFLAFLFPWPPGPHAGGPNASYGHFLRLYLDRMTLITLVLEGMAIEVLVMGVACWPLRTIRSRRWVVSSFGIVFVAAAFLILVCIAIGKAGTSSRP